MTKQELLTKLATECATWKAATSLGNAECWSKSQRNPGGCSFTITHHDWLAERERLLNKPSWDDAPSGAEYIASLAIAIPAGYGWRDSLEERPVDSNTGGIDSQTKQSIMKRFLTVK